MLALYFKRVIDADINFERNIAYDIKRNKIDPKDNEVYSDILGIKPSGDLFSWDGTDFVPVHCDYTHENPSILSLNPFEYVTSIYIDDVVYFRFNEEGKPEDVFGDLIIGDENVLYIEDEDVEVMYAFNGPDNTFERIYPLFGNLHAFSHTMEVSVEPDAMTAYDENKEEVVGDLDTLYIDSLGDLPTNHIYRWDSLNFKPYIFNLYNTAASFETRKHHHPEKEGHHERRKRRRFKE